MAVSENKNLTIHIATSSILRVAGILLLLFFVYYIGDILLLVVISIILAAVIEPMVNWLATKKIPRSLGGIFIYAVILSFVVLIVRLLLPPIIEQLTLLAQNFPDFWEKMMEHVSAFEQSSQNQIFVDNMQQGLTSLLSGLETAAGGAYGFIISVFQNVINFITVLVITFYLAVEKDAIAKVLRLITPPKHYAHVIELYDSIQVKIGDWARGQLLLGLIIGSFAFVGLMFLLPKYALVLALVAGFTEMIPYLGPILGAIPAVFLGFTIQPFSLARGIAVLALYILIQEFENNIIVPQVMKKKMGLNPVVVVLVMLIGARLAGIIGIILSIPVATSIGILAKDFLGRSRLSEMKSDIRKK